ncbi:hypothetical protein [Paraburkholderia aromaticivorans]|uniref:hypothetical protein n=1 Tax=Paraburkholderia aromaticivorans TaxID=2026199 RepID=UPI0038B83706
MNLFFWMLLNLGVPIIGPIFTLTLVAPAHGWRVAKALIAGSVKDGQLFWCAIGLLASTVYEAVTALERGRGEASVLAHWVAGLCVMAFTCSSLVMSGLVNPHSRRARQGAPRRNSLFADGSFSPTEIVLSVFFTVIAAALLASLHVQLI